MGLSFLFRRRQTIASNGIKMKQAFQFNLIYILIDSIRCAKCHHKQGAYSIEELK